MIEISAKRARQLWRTYESLGQQLKELLGDPLGPNPGDDDNWTVLPLSSRPYNAIMGGSEPSAYPVAARLPVAPQTVGDLAALRDSDFLRLKNFGRGSLDEVREAIRVHRIQSSRQEHAQDGG